MIGSGLQFSRIVYPSKDPRKKKDCQRTLRQRDLQTIIRQPGRNQPAVFKMCARWWDYARTKSTLTLFNSADYGIYHRIGTVMSARLRRSASAESWVYANSPLRSIGALSAFSHRFWTCGELSASLLKIGIVAVRPRHPVLRPLRLVRHRRFLQILGHLPVRLARRWEW